MEIERSEWPEIYRDHGYRLYTTAMPSVGPFRWTTRVRAVWLVKSPALKELPVALSGQFWGDSAAASALAAAIAVHEWIDAQYPPAGTRN